MRLNFKKDFLLVTAMLVAAGCSDSMTGENNPEQQVPIAFGTQVATRAVVESDKEGMDNLHTVGMGTGKRRAETVFRCRFGYSVGKLWRETFLGCRQAL